jgi:hypothetical protein
MTHNWQPETPRALRELCDRLPIPAAMSLTPYDTGVLTMLHLRKMSLAEFVSMHKLGLACEVAAEQTKEPRALLDMLMQAGHELDAVNFLACALPPREGLWWATRFAWDMVLDTDRALWTQSCTAMPGEPARATTAVAQSKNAVPPSLSSIAQAIASSGALQATTAAVQNALAEPMIAEALGDESVVAGGLHFSARIDAAMRSARAPSARQVVPRLTDAEIDQSESAMSDSHAGDVSLERHIEARKSKLRLRALAAVLQWIVHPCHANAIVAADAAQAISFGGIAKALATAAFWSGENLNTKSSGAVVPPPPTLRSKGLRAAFAKALVVNDGLLGEADRLHWCLGLGLQAAEGHEHWDTALDEFRLYEQYATSTHEPPNPQ